MPPHSAHRDRPPDARARPCHHTRRTAIVPPDARARPCHHTRRIEGVPPDPRPRPCHHTRRTASVRRRAGATMLPHSANRDRAETRGRDHTTTLGKSRARISRKWLTDDRITANARTARASVAPRPGSRGRVRRHGRVRAGECGATAGFARASAAPRPGSRGRVWRHGWVRAGDPTGRRWRGGRSARSRVGRPPRAPVRSGALRGTQHVQAESRGAARRIGGGNSIVRRKTESAVPECHGLSPVPGIAGGRSREPWPAGRGGSRIRPGRS